MVRSNPPTLADFTSKKAAGQATDGTETLRRVYETFTEGFETADLVEARALLTEGAT